MYHQHGYVRFLPKSLSVFMARSYKYGKLPPKTTLTIPWVALCVNLMGPYSLKGKESTAINFMCAKMIDLATSWFEIMKLLVTGMTQCDIPPVGKKGQKGMNKHDTKSKETDFDKSSATVGSLVD